MACSAPGKPDRYFSTDKIAQLWLNAGGDPASVVVAVAIALAESCDGNANALSSADAIGLWQILGGHAAEQGIAEEQLYEPSVNAWFAVELSGNGANWAPWDTAYTTLAGAAQRYALSYPEQGSPAYNRIPSVAAALGVTGTQSAGMPTTDEPQPGHTTVPPVPVPGPGGDIRGAPLPGAPATGGIPGPFAIPSDIPSYSGERGWDNLVQYWGRDQQELWARQQNLQQIIAHASGGSRWQG